MSAAKMVADSTQGDLLELGSSRKRKIVQKKKPKKRKDSGKKKKNNSSEDDYDSSDLDLDKHVQPLGHYVKDRGTLLEEMFHCMQGECLQRHLPDVLKELPLEDLKKRCLEQLEVMSKKRIRRIIAGDDPSTISSSGTEDETTEEENEHAGVEVEEGEFAEQEGTFEGEMEDTLEGEVEDAMEGDSDREEQVADSTSLYTQDTAQSDREDWDDSNADDGSVAHTNQSPAYSNDYQVDDQQYGNVNQDYSMETEDVVSESGSDFVEVPKPNKGEYKPRESRPVKENVPVKLKKKVVVKRDPKEEPEEGEVFDDDDEEDEEEEEVQEHNKAATDGDETNLLKNVDAEANQKEPLGDPNVSNTADDSVNIVNKDEAERSIDDGKMEDTVTETNECKCADVSETGEAINEVEEPAVGTISSTENEQEKDQMDPKPDIKPDCKILKENTDELDNIKVKEEIDDSDLAINRENADQCISTAVSSKELTVSASSSDGLDSGTGGSDTRNVKIKTENDGLATLETTGMVQKKRVIVIKESNKEEEKSGKAAEDISKTAAEHSECVNVNETESNNEKSDGSGNNSEAAASIREEDSNGDDDKDKSQSNSESDEEQDNSVDKGIAEPGKSSAQAWRVVKPPSREIAPALTRNQMELLELEMRARAIKAMLKKATLK